MRVVEHKVADTAKEGAPHLAQPAAAHHDQLGVLVVGHLADVHARLLGAHTQKVVAGEARVLQSLANALAHLLGRLLPLLQLGLEAANHVAAFARRGVKPRLDNAQHVDHVARPAEFAEEEIHGSLAMLTAVHRENDVAFSEKVHLRGDKTQRKVRRIARTAASLFNRREET